MSLQVLYSKNYSKLGYTLIGIKLQWDSHCNKKVIKFKSLWQTATLKTYKFFINNYDNGLALVAGEASDLIVIDCDIAKEDEIDGIAFFKELATSNVPCQKSASGGMHYFYSLSKSIDKELVTLHNITRVKIDSKVSSIDIRADGGCIIVYPSILNNNSYEFIIPLCNTEDLLSLPDVFINILNRQSFFKISTLVTNFQNLSLNTEYNSLYSDTKDTIEKVLNVKINKYWIRQNGFDFKPIHITECKLRKRTHTTNGYLVRKIIEDVFYIKNYSSYCKASTFNWDSNNLIQGILSNSGSDQPYAILLNAIFNSYGHPIVCSGNDIFMFNSIIWEEISELKMQAHIIHTTESILLLLIKYISDVEVRKTLKKAYHYISKIVYIKSIVSYYKTLYNYDEIKAKMNINPDILPVKNGVIDLCTGVLNIRNSDNYMSIQLKVNYKKLDYPTPIIDKFIADLFNDKQELFIFVQKLLGYGITGHTNMQVWAMFTGDESNGKSLLVSLIEELLQGWCTVAPYEIFFNSNKKASEGAHLAHLVAIKDKRVCIRSESNPKNKLNTKILKIITGGDILLHVELMKVVMKHLYQLHY